MRTRTVTAGALLVSFLVAGCAHRGGEPVSTPAVEDPFEGKEESVEDGRQTLLRVRYRGLDGRGRVRLTVRTVADGRFQMAAADVFGRPLWTFGGGAGESVLLDHRQREVCRYDGDIVVQAIALGELPVRLLPRVLLGSLPFRLAGTPPSGEIEHIDRDGRRWTATLGENGSPRRWSLWQGDAPLVWWQATDEGAILSHRGGAQAIWSIVADELLDRTLAPLEVPKDYRPGQCDEPPV